jgi:catalase
MAADEKIGGGPSVLYDAIAVLPSKDGAASLLSNASAKDFISDAFGHLKFIAFVKAATPLFEKAGIPEDLDDGFIELTGRKSAAQFVAACRKLRLWQREQVVTT